MDVEGGLQFGWDIVGIIIACLLYFCGCTFSRLLRRSNALQGATELPITRFPVERLPNGMPVDDDLDEPMHIIRSYL